MDYDIPSDDNREWTKVEPYHGKTLREAHEFLESLDSNFVMNPEFFATKEKKIICARMHLKENPREVYRSPYNAYVTNITHFSQFKRFFYEQAVHLDTRV